MKRLTWIVALGLIASTAWAKDDVSIPSPQDYKMRQALHPVAVLELRRGVDLSEFDAATRDRLATEFDTEIKINADALAEVDQHPEKVDALIADAREKVMAGGSKLKEVLSGPNDQKMFETMVKRARFEAAMFTGPDVSPLLHIKSPLSGFLDKLRLTDDQRKKVADLRKSTLAEVQKVHDTYDKVEQHELDAGHDVSSDIQQAECNRVGLEAAKTFRDLLQSEQLKTWTDLIKAGPPKAKQSP